MKLDWKRIALAVGVTVSLGVAAQAQAQETSLRVVGNFSGNKKHVDGVERPFFNKLDERDDLAVSYNTMDAIGVEAADALRLIRTGAFDVMSVQIGMASRDDPFFEGVDLAGVAANLDEQREVVEAIREKFDQRLQERFNAKLLTLWPFGPQMMFCSGVDGVEDLADKKVRVFTPSMSRLVEGLGASPVTLQFSEVYLALQRGVADCAVTAPTAGNSAKWPEVTDSFVPLPLSFSVQGHFMNLDTWNRLSDTQQEELTAAFRQMEKQMWDIARNVNDDAIDCNIGRESCSEHESYDMQLVDIGETTREEVSDVTAEAVLPVWGEDCNAIYPECTQVWNDTVGEATGYAIDLQ
ncbi:TRAP transporter substrate-binding protein [Arhodomonas sp. AD133]|uniref:TRAP transporter substrate-binding protein n=1 Tax=Arhodomonas sp. AD133 TaxID=3415009 RepID=UPI003EBAF4F9